MDEIAQAGYSVGNVDVTLICERPKLRPHVDAIRLHLAELLRVPISSVSVKGKTNEGMDATGEGVGIAVHAVALVESSEG
jgi:2-C-methyl-D-erythritol 2,4-cyclodiphosphate synthase